MTDEDANVLTWPRWLGRGMAFGLVVGLGAAMFALGTNRGDGELSGAAIAAIGAVFAGGGFVVGLWQQIRPTSMWFARDVIWRSSAVWCAEIVVVGGLGYLAGVVSG